MFCTNCGVQNHQGASFCAACGQKMQGLPPPQSRQGLSVQQQSSAPHLTRGNEPEPYSPLTALAQQLADLQRIAIHNPGLARTIYMRIVAQEERALLNAAWKREEARHIKAVQEGREPRVGYHDDGHGNFVRDFREGEDSYTG